MKRCPSGVLVLLVCLAAAAPGAAEPLVGMRCPPPQRLPDFALPLDRTNAGVISRRDIGNRPLFLFFFSPVDRASRTTLPFVEKIFRTFHVKGLVVVGMEQPDAPAPGKPVLRDPQVTRKRFDLGFPVGLDIAGAENIFCVSRLPTSLFYDRRGRLEAELSGPAGYANLADLARATLSR